MAYQISGIQQVGIGVPQVDEAWDFYAKTFGQKARVFREAAPAPFMTRYTGNTVQSRDAL
ncbi:MAG: VOC family protein, partial [Bacteroidetes bacterium]|nr:VOC family protein [Bacteroidota bacterium]